MQRIPNEWRENSSYGSSDLIDKVAGLKTNFPTGIFNDFMNSCLLKVRITYLHHDFGPHWLVLNGKYNILLYKQDLFTQFHKSYFLFIVQWLTTARFY